MKYIILACLCAAASAVYTDMDENLDVVDIVQNQDLRPYIDCFLDKKPCTDSMYSYKKHLREAINNTCAYCTPSQMHIVEEFIKVILAKYPDSIIEIMKKYDPEGTQFQRLLAKLAKY